MRRVDRKAVLLGLAGLTSFAVAAAGQAVSPEVKQPNGRIQVATTSVAVGAGVTWGDGTLTFRGKDHAFTIKNLSLTDLGIGNAAVKGMSTTWASLRTSPARTQSLSRISPWVVQDRRGRALIAE
jgi:hypothetical protein